MPPILQIEFDDIGLFAGGHHFAQVCYSVDDGTVRSGPAYLFEFVRYVESIKVLARTDLPVPA